MTGRFISKQKTEMNKEKGTSLEKFARQERRKKESGDEADEGQAAQWDKKGDEGGAWSIFPNLGES